MLNIRATLTNLRTNQTYTVNHIPVELAKLQIKGKFDIKFPFGFNRGISAEKVKFVKAERQLLLTDYKIWGRFCKLANVNFLRQFDATFDRDLRFYRYLMG